jgi:hypothetical protein
MAPDDQKKYIDLNNKRDTVLRSIKKLDVRSACMRNKSSKHCVHLYTVDNMTFP